MSSSIQVSDLASHSPSIFQGTPVAAYAEDQYHVKIVTQFRGDSERWRLRVAIGWRTIEDTEQFMFLCLDESVRPPIPMFVIGQRIQ